MLIHCSGPSGSGKDTFWTNAKIFLANKGIEAHKVSFVRPLKDALERNFNMPEFYLDTEIGKSMIMPGTSKTFLEVLIATYWASQDNIFSEVWSNIALYKIQEHLINGHWVFLTDVRSKYELETLKRLHCNNPFVSIEIYGRGAALSSDQYSSEISTELLRHFHDPYKAQYFRVDNSGQEAQFIENIKRIMDKIS